MAVCAAAVLVPCIVLHFTCHQHNRPAYRVPFFPYTPAASLLLNCFLMASLPAQAYWQLGLFFGIVSIFYVLYSIHAGEGTDENLVVGKYPVKRQPQHRGSLCSGSHLLWRNLAVRFRHIHICFGVSLGSGGRLRCP
jgi:hypothetical protein